MRPRAVVAGVVPPFPHARAYGKFHMTTATTAYRPPQGTDLLDPLMAARFVTPKNGQVASVAALQLLWRLEDAGMVIRLGGGRLQVGPQRRLTVDDDAAIRAHRDELVALVEMCEAM